MVRYVVAYFLTLIVFFAIDFVWLGTVAKSFYRNEIGPLLLDKFNIPVAVFFYVMYIIGIMIFAVSPSLKGGSLWNVLLLRRAVRLLYLRDLRLYQSGHTKRLHAQTGDRRHCLGYVLWSRRAPCLARGLHG